MPRCLITTKPTWPFGSGFVVKRWIESNRKEEESKTSSKAPQSFNICAWVRDVDCLTIISANVKDVVNSLSTNE